MDKRKMTETELKQRLGLAIAFARRIAKIRGLEMEQLAGIEQSRLSRVENGWRWPYPDELERMVKVLQRRNKAAAIDADLLAAVAPFLPKREKKDEEVAA